VLGANKEKQKMLEEAKIYLESLRLQQNFKIDEHSGVPKRRLPEEVERN
jgi:hypothetical protein